MSTPPPLQTYHCLCATFLLATPYSLSTLPRRAPPSLDRAHILPRPALSNAAGNQDTAAFLPSLLTPNLRPARKVVVVRREDGFERRRVYRCARCAVCVGYEVLGEGEGEEGRVLYLLEGGLVETGELGGEREG